MLGGLERLFPEDLDRSVLLRWTFVGMLFALTVERIAELTTKE